MSIIEKNAKSPSLNAENGEVVINKAKEASATGIKIKANSFVDNTTQKMTINASNNETDIKYKPKEKSFLSTRQTKISDNRREPVSPEIIVKEFKSQGEGMLDMQSIILKAVSANIEKNIHEHAAHAERTVKTIVKEKGLFFDTGLKYQ